MRLVRVESGEYAAECGADRPVLRVGDQGATRDGSAGLTPARRPSQFCREVGQAATFMKAALSSGFAGMVQPCARRCSRSPWRPLLQSSCSSSSS